MAKFKVLLRDDSASVSTRSEVIEFDGTLSELLQHAHILEAEKMEEKKEEVKDKKDNKKK